MKNRSKRPQYTGWYSGAYAYLDTAFELMPNFIGTFIATIFIVLAGSTMRGDWLFILVHLICYYHAPESNYDSSQSIENETDDNYLTEGWSLKKIKLESISFFIFINMFFSYIMYFSLCGFLQWYFYIRRRDLSKEWKCQPEKFLTPEVERHEIVLGTMNVSLGSFLFAILSCYVYNGGWTTIYLGVTDYGWTWFFLSIPLHFLYQDAGAYYVHRGLHTRFFYKHFHKWHHYYKQPTAFSTTAMHPAELVFFEIFMILPAFVIPVHAGVYVANMVYIYYYGIITHSGIEMEAVWPWQPNVSFHDNHHQYVHVNFGFNTEIFDKFHGTKRIQDRVYNETIYGGKGMALKDASEALKQEHAKELASELKPKNGQIVK